MSGANLNRNFTSTPGLDRHREASGHQVLSRSTTVTRAVEHSTITLIAVKSKRREDVEDYEIPKSSVDRASRLFPSRPHAHEA